MVSAHDLTFPSEASSFEANNTVFVSLFRLGAVGRGSAASLPGGMLWFIDAPSHGWRTFSVNAASAGRLPWPASWPVSARRPISISSDPEDQIKLTNPKQVLERLEGLVILDEIQRKPELTLLLRVLSDRKPLPCRFLILGSSAPDMMKQASDSLAGRVHFVDMTGLALEEVGVEAQSTLWLRGGFPPAFLAESDTASWAWRRDFLRTFLERDLPQLGVRVGPEMLSDWLVRNARSLEPHRPLPFV